MNVGEIYVKLGLEAKKFEQGLSSAKKNLALFAAEITATVYLVDRFIEKSTNAATRMTNLGYASGMTASKLRQAGLAASLGNAGISAENASAQISDFAANLYSLQKLGTGNAQGFNWLAQFGEAINYEGKDALTVIKEIADRGKRLNDQEFSTLLGAFNFGPEMLDWFRNYDELMARAENEFGLSKDQLQQLAEADKVISEFKKTLTQLSALITIEAAPAIKELGQALRGLGGGNGELDALSITMKSLATSIQLIAAGIEATFAAAKIAGVALGSGSVHGNEEINQEIRNNAKKSLSERWEKIEGMWGRDWSKPIDGGNSGKWKEHHIKAAIRRLYEESGFNPNIYGSGKEAKGGPIEAYGIAQWNPARQKDFEAWAGKSIKGASLADQIRFVNYELTHGKEKRAGAAFFEAENENDAYKVFTNEYERPLRKTTGINMTNTFNIHGENAKESAALVSAEMERQFKHALADQNNGAR